MNFKPILAIFFALTLAVVSLSIASATLTAPTSVNIPSPVNSNAGSFNITFFITSDVDTTINFTEDSAQVNSVIGSPTTLVANMSTMVRAQLNFANQNGPLSGNLRVHSSDGDTETINFNVNLNQESLGFCRFGVNGTDILDVSIDVNNRGNSEDSEDDNWILLDDVEIEVDVRNNGDEDLDNVIVVLGLLDSNGNNHADELDFVGSDEEESDNFDLKDGKRETVTFSFRVPVDFSTGDYEVVAKAFPEGDENQICVEDPFGSIDVDFENDKDRLVVIGDLILPSEAVCRETVTGEATVFNIGDDTQDRVLVTIINSQLDINEEVEIVQRIDEGEEDKFNFAFEIPADARDGVYPIQFRTEYQYDSGVYEERSEISSYSLRLIGCDIGSSGNGNLDITASLDSDAIAGEELVVVANIRNTGTTAQTFVIEANGYQSWAKLESISESIVTLNAGQSRNVEFTFAIDSDASGAQSFNIRGIVGEAVESQRVEVLIKDASNGIGFNLPGNSLIWIIAAINLVLIILIILVAIRLSRR